MPVTDDPTHAVRRYRAVRWVGLVGAVLLAVAAYRGGALPALPTATTPAGIWREPAGPLVGVAWLTGTGLLVGAWWQARPGVPSTGWALRTAGLWALPLLVAPPLGSRDVYSYACQGRVYADGGDPYAGGVAGAGCPWLDAVAPIWRDTPAPYGPVFVLLAGAAAALGGTLVGTLVGLRVVAVAGVLLAAACLPGLARAAGVPPERAAWLALACPLVGVHLVGGAHNDAVMLGLLLAGLLVVLRHPGRRGWLLLGGALLGLAVAVKVTALVAVPFAVLGAVCDPGPLRALLRAGSRVLAGTLGALVGTSAVAGLGPGWLGGLARSGDTAQWTSPPTAVGLVVDYAGRLVGRDPGGVRVLRAVALVLLAAVLVALWCRTWRGLRRLGRPPTGPSAALSGVRPGVSSGAPEDRDARPTVAHPRAVLTGAGLALAATVALAPVFHPWYATWPLAVLAVSAARPGWYALPCALAAFLALPDGSGLARFTKAPGALLMTGLVIVLLVRAVRHRRLLSLPVVEEGPTRG